jgi:hypothetical protein
VAEAARLRPPRTPFLVPEGKPMYRRLLGRALLAPLVVALACGGKGEPSADVDPAAELRDLVGVRGSAAESQLEARGYVAVGGDSHSGASLTYRRRAGDGSCVSVRTFEGRYEAIDPATRQDCERAETATRVVAEPDAGGYRTACGVMVDGEPVRYVCSVVGGDQRSTPTTLRFPDTEMVLHWQGGGRVRVEIEGLAPIEGTWTESEGETDIVTPEKTWFYVSNREAAALEVRSMEPLCSDAWYRSIEEQVPTGDGRGHGPDVGSEEWKSVIERKLGIRGQPGLPSHDSQAWCSHVDQIVREGRAR